MWHVWGNVVEILELFFLCIDSSLWCVGQPGTAHYVLKQLLSCLWSCSSEHVKVAENPLPVLSERNQNEYPALQGYYPRHCTRNQCMNIFSLFFCLKRWLHKHNWILTIHLSKLSNHYTLRSGACGGSMVNNQAPGALPVCRSCAGCGGKIADRFLLFSMECYWHTRCLKCSCCQAQLGDIGTTCYSKGGMILCRSDYIR